MVKKYKCIKRYCGDGPEIGSTREEVRNYIKELNELD